MARRRWLQRPGIGPHLRPLPAAAAEAPLLQAFALQLRRNPQFGAPPEAIDLRLEVGRQPGTQKPKKNLSPDQGKRFWPRALAGEATESAIKTSPERLRNKSQGLSMRLNSSDSERITN